VIFCHCAVVTDRTVAAALDAGARTVAQVCRATGAGQGCGTCVFALKRLICQHDAESEVTVQEVGVAAG
jgi:bacterioferritin-associated ferredoxin